MVAWILSLIQQNKRIYKKFTTVVKLFLLVIKDVKCAIIVRYLL